jgi:hypothetical protein
MIIITFTVRRTDGTRIPSATSISQISHMATILFNNIETIPIPYISPNNTSIHNPNGVCDTILKTTLWENYMISFAIVTIHLKPIGFNYKILL